MRVQTEEWRQFIPGVRVYKGKMTLFYNGEKLVHENGRTPFIYNTKERQTWQVIIVLPGVEIIPWSTFCFCYNVKTVIMADSVQRIEGYAFSDCKKLDFVKLSRNLEKIGYRAFFKCESLTSIFIPDSCREFGNEAFHQTKVIMLVLPPHTRLGGESFSSTPLWKESVGFADTYQKVVWAKSINDDAEYALHRLCSSMDPSEDEIYQMICEQGGLHAMTKKNSIGITPSKYLSANPYANVEEMKLLKRFVLENMGEIA